jgi:hypothetical protein
MFSASALTMRMSPARSLVCADGSMRRSLPRIKPMTSACAFEKSATSYSRLPFSFDFSDLHFGDIVLDIEQTIAGRFALADGNQAPANKRDEENPSHRHARTDGGEIEHGKGRRTVLSRKEAAMMFGGVPINVVMPPSRDAKAKRHQQIRSRDLFTSEI